MAGVGLLLRRAVLCSVATGIVPMAVFRGAPWVANCLAATSPQQRNNEAATRGWQSRSRANLTITWTIRSHGFQQRSLAELLFEACGNAPFERTRCTGLSSSLLINTREPCRCRAVEHKSTPLPPFCRGCVDGAVGRTDPELVAEDDGERSGPEVAHSDVGRMSGTSGLFASVLVWRRFALRLRLVLDRGM